MAKQRVHNEYFRQVSRGNRKSCSNCYEKLPPGESIWCWGEYHSLRWYSVQDFCINCWDKGYYNPKQRLIDHARPCGCTFQLVGYHCTLPAWLTLDTVLDYEPMHRAAFSPL